MKRMLALILAILVMFTVAGCSKDEENALEPLPAPELEEDYVSPSNTEAVGSITYHDVWLEELDEGDFVLEIRYQISNDTDLDMGEYHVGMLAFDEQGQPLELRWNPLSGDAPSYLFLCDWLQDEELVAGGSYLTEDGGWTLWSDDAALREQYQRIAYVLFEIAQVTFADGSLWVNEEFDDWREDYEGQELELAELMNYYPSSIYL